jgi:hypothetical protein
MNLDQVCAAIGGHVTYLFASVEPATTAGSGGLQSVGEQLADCIGVTLGVDFDVLDIDLYGGLVWLTRCQYRDLDVRLYLAALEPEDGLDQWRGWIITFPSLMDMTDAQFETLHLLHCDLLKAVSDLKIAVALQVLNAPEFTAV